MKNFRKFACLLLVTVLFSGSSSLAATKPDVSVQDALCTNCNIGTMTKQPNEYSNWFYEGTIPCKLGYAHFTDDVYYRYVFHVYKCTNTKCQAVQTNISEERKFEHNHSLN